MQTKLRIRIWALLFATLCTVGAGIILTSCQKEEPDTKVVLQSFGPMPIARGAELKFIGLNLDRVTAIILPNNITITTFTTKTPNLITLTVPQEAMPGYVILKTPEGDITTKTPIGYSEPISIASFTPATVKAGDVLTITGDYLNLVGEVIFTDRVSVMKASFDSQTRTEIKLKVPEQAQTGKIAVSDAEEDPIIVYSTTSLTVKLPAFTAITPNPVKAGTALTITGTDLDLVKSIVLGGNKTITTFVSHTATEIVLNVPDDTKDGKVTMIPASGVNVVSSADLVMVVPTVSVTPVTLKNGQNITVTGTNLDLIDKVIFGGDKQGTIVAGGTATEIQVTVPDAAVTGVVKFVTKALKEVPGPNLTLIDPVFTSFSPTSAKANTSIAISGTDLDLVVDVVFEGGMKGSIGSRTETLLNVTVPVGAKTGKITLVAKNGTQVKSAIDFTILANLPVFSSYSESRAEPGKILTINGTSMLLVKELIFPGNVYATAYGTKTDSKIEVYVPMSATRGYGTIKLITYEGEEGLFPEVFIGSTDPVVDPALMINDFETNANWHNLGWDNWGGNAEQVCNDPVHTLSGCYMHGTNSGLTGWAWIWGCNHDQMPKPSVTKADHVLKIDFKLTKPYGSSNVHFQMELAGTRIDVGGFGITGAAETTTGWVTVTYDLATFSALPATIPGSGEWGINFWYADGPVDITGMYMDNIRFEHK